MKEGILYFEILLAAFFPFRASSLPAPVSSPCVGRTATHCQARATGPSCMQAALGLAGATHPGGRAGVFGL